MNHHDFIFAEIEYNINNDVYSLSFDDLIRKDVDKELGSGISSVVFEMYHNSTNKSFAVKVCISCFY